METAAAQNLFENDFKQSTTDSRVNCSCGRSLDELIDLARLRSPDSSLIEKINHHMLVRADECEKAALSARSGNEREKYVKKLPRVVRFPLPAGHASSPPAR